MRQRNSLTEQLKDVNVKLSSMHKFHFCFQHSAFTWKICHPHSWYVWFPVTWYIYHRLSTNSGLSRLWASLVLTDISPAVPSCKKIMWIFSGNPHNSWYKIFLSTDILEIKIPSCFVIHTLITTNTRVGKWCILTASSV